MNKVRRSTLLGVLAIIFFIPGRVTPAAARRQSTSHTESDSHGASAAKSRRAASAKHGKTGVKTVARSGRWRVADGKGAMHRWKARLEQTPDEGALRGSITMEGAGPARSGNVEGEITRGAVEGIITDAGGSILARFEGSGSGRSMSGTFQASDGESGTWSLP